MLEVPEINHKLKVCDNEINSLFVNKMIVYLLVMQFLTSNTLK